MALRIERFLETTVRIGATDLYLYPGQQPQVWVDGQLRELETSPVSGEEISASTKILCSAQAWQNFEKAGRIEFEYCHDGKADLRVRVAFEHGAIAAVFPRS